MTSPGKRESTLYELTVVGAFGPVLRGMLETCVSVSAELHAIIHTGLLEDRDLVDLVLLFESRGLELTKISAMT
jgi:hypothetical protein